MVTAAEVKVLQASNITQEQALAEALTRCDLVLTDVAKNRKETCTYVTVFKLEKTTLKLLEKELKARGFQVISEYKNLDRSVVTIGW